MQIYLPIAEMSINIFVLLFYPAIALNLKGLGAESAPAHPRPLPVHGVAGAAGNAVEVRNAVDFLTGAAHDQRLLEVTLSLAAHALVLAGTASDVTVGHNLAEGVLASGEAAERFGRMVSALGGPADFISNLDQHLSRAPIVRDVFADRSGAIASIDTRKLGMAVVALGGGRRTPSDTIDHSVGFDHLIGLGAKADSNSPIARIHARDETSCVEAERRLREAYQIGKPQDVNPLIVETILPE